MARGKPLRARSKKRVQETRARANELQQGRRCEVCPILDAAGIAHPRCPGAQGFHERRKSSAGGSRANPANLLAACNFSNGLVEDECGLVRGLTSTLLIVREGDPEWEELGRRLDRMRTPQQDQWPRPAPPA